MYQEAIKAFNGKYYTKTLNLHRQARDGHIQKIVRGGVHPGQ